MKTALERLYKKVSLQINGCWYWTGARFQSGYGAFSYQGKPQRAHRISYELHKESIPPGMYVLHTCDTPQCINPDHLFLGTQLDNITDCIKKNRLPQVRRSRNARTI